VSVVAAPGGASIVPPLPRPARAGTALAAAAGVGALAPSLPPGAAALAAGLPSPAGKGGLKGGGRGAGGKAALQPGQAIEGAGGTQLVLDASGTFVAVGGGGDRGGGDKGGKGKGADEDAMTVVVKGLSFTVEEDKLRSDFEQCGEIDFLKMLQMPDGKPKGISFIRFKSDEGFRKASASERHGATGGRSA
ncbi:unnamed protein product, partial [Prorocentrum cordatum]